MKPNFSEDKPTSIAWSKYCKMQNQTRMAVSDLPFVLPLRLPYSCWQHVQTETARSRSIQVMKPSDSIMAFWPLFDRATRSPSNRWQRPSMNGACWTIPCHRASHVILSGKPTHTHLRYIVSWTTPSTSSCAVWRCPSSAPSTTCSISENRPLPMPVMRNYSKP